MEVVLQLVLMVDSRLVEIGAPSVRSFEKSGLGWFVEGENHDYIAPELLQVEESELMQFERTSQELYQLLIQTAEEVYRRDLLVDLGIPPQAKDLIGYSLREEKELHLIGRFDFAGGLNGGIPKMLEFNADTCSLIPETCLVQPYQKDLLPRKHRRSAYQFNRLQSKLELQLQRMLQARPQLHPSFLVSGLGHMEDIINLDVVADVAEKVGFADVQQVNLEQLVFSPEEGIFLEINPGEYAKFDFWFKMVPWEFILFEEPQLFKDLEQIIRKGLAVVANPAFTMLLQSKGIMKYLYEWHSDHPAVLKTSFSAQDFSAYHYVEKPMFGRTGDNVKIFQGSKYPTSENAGDYGSFRSVYQEVAQFDQDEDGDIYQPSVFWTGMPSAMCFRRQDDLIIDDDAEFVGHFVKR